VYAETALFVADQYFKTQSAVKYPPKGPQTPSAAYVPLSRQMYHKIVRDLLCEQGRRIEVYTGSNVKWTLSQHASPGNLQGFEDLCDGTALDGSAAIIALKIAKEDAGKVMGIAVCDASMSTLGLCEFVDDEQFSTLEAVLVQLSAKECLVSGDIDKYDMSILNDVFQRCKVVMTERKKVDFQAKDTETDLNRLVNEKFQNLSHFEKKHAMGSAACVLKYLSLMSDETNFGHYSMLDLDITKFLKLDGGAIRALHLTPLRGESNKNTSVYGVLNKCRTAMGQRRLMQWIKQPLLDIKEIGARHDLVEIFSTDTMLRQSLMDALKKVPDMDRMAKKFFSLKANLQDCVALYDFVISLPNMLECFQQYEGEHTSVLDTKYIKTLRETINDTRALQELVETSINLDLVSSHEYKIKPELDEGLEVLASETQELYNDIADERDKVNSDSDLPGNDLAKLELDPRFGYCLRVTRKEEKHIRGKSKYEQLASVSKGVMFTTKKLKGLSNQHREKAEEYETKQQDLVMKLIGVVASYVPVMEDMREMLSTLDVILSFAHVAVNAPVAYVRPTMTEGVGNIVLKEARHPCIEVLDELGASYIPNDVELVRGKSHFEIITGPNMGGKSTYIRTVGIVALMAQIGCYVPCTEATISVTDAILARVGAGDSQLRGVSTFMQEMLETSFILRAATEKSLVIIDELGRGTSTYDGFGLAWAISEHLARDVKAFCLFATHFHELTALAKEVPGVRNVHVSALAEDQKLTMLYQVKPGPCDQSFGIHVAEMVHFPAHVIEMAKRKAAELEDFGENLKKPVEGSPAKRAKTEQKAAEGLIDNFLNDFALLPLDTMSDEEALSQVNKLKEGLAKKGENQPAIAAMLAGL